MQFHRLNSILVRDSWRRAEERWRTLNDLELLLANIPLHHVRRQFALRKAIRTYRRIISK